jgi:hypothetical protein
LRQQLSEQTKHLTRSTPDDAGALVQERRLKLTALVMKEQSAQVVAALARTEENPAGGRMPSAEGRERAKRLADAALAV